MKRRSGIEERKEVEEEEKKMKGRINIGAPKNNSCTGGGLNIDTIKL